jgi:predicted Fe-Mo cluster-binding NifX family protein
MRIAVPTSDGVTISPHFGRSAGFLVFEAEGGDICSCVVKANPAGHAHAEHACAGNHVEESHGAHAAHDHSAIVSAIAGCEVVLCAGVGQRAVDALRQGGVREIVVTEPGPAEARVRDYLNGTLPPSPAHFCGCRH